MQTEVNGILYNRVKIKQLKDGYRFSVDSMLLSWFSIVKENSKVIDLGTGNGIVAILLALKTKKTQIVGIDIVKEFTEMAEENVRNNGLSGCIKIIHGDIKDVKRIFPPESFDVAVANPPYLPLNGSRLSDSWSKRVSKYEWSLTIEELAKAASYLLPTKGQLFLIHKPQQILRLFAALQKCNLTPKEILFVHPYHDKKAEFVLIRAVKGAKKQVNVLPPMIMYNKDRSPTEMFKQIYEI